MGARHFSKGSYREARQLQSQFGGRRQKSYGRIDQSSARPLAHGAAHDARLWHANSAHQGLHGSLTLIFAHKREPLSNEFTIQEKGL